MGCTTISFTSRRRGRSRPTSWPGWMRARRSGRAEAQVSVRHLFVVASIAALSACGGPARAPVALRAQPVPQDAARARLDPAAPAHFAVGLTLQDRDALE